MKASTVHEMSGSNGIDVAGNVRAEMGRARVSASTMSRTYGGSVTYWTRRMNGELEFTAHDLQLVAEATGCHPSELLDGVAPSGWTPGDGARKPNLSKRHGLYLVRPDFHRFSELRNAS